MLWNTLMQNNKKDAPVKTEEHSKSERNGAVVGDTLRALMGKSLNENKKEEEKINQETEEESKDPLSVSFSDKQVEIIFADVKMEVKFTQLA